MILGESGKFRPGGVTVNFGRSGGVYCWDGCKLLDNECYAERLERRHDRQQLHRKLERMERLHPSNLCYMAAAEVQARLHEGWNIPWFRFAMAGALPAASQWGRDWGGLRLLCEILHGFEIPVHMPIEEPRKAAWYRSKVGDLVTIRQSIQTSGVRAAGACSFVAGDASDNPRARLESARDLARRRTEATGRPCKVCPHTEWATLHRGEPMNPKTKCGKGGCCACAKPDVDVVYPLTLK